MTDHQEDRVPPNVESVLPVEGDTPKAAENGFHDAAPPEGEHRNSTTVERRQWHAEAGRKGAHRVHQLIQEGKLYEKEHGLKRGRQRLRQLLELGKLYEEEHGLQPGGVKKGGQRLARVEREELLTTFLQCLIRIAKPSFRAELVRLVQTLQEQPAEQRTEGVA